LNMNTDEIRRTLRNTKNFDDVYSIDTLPARPCGLLVCNTQSSEEPGEHWICIHVDEDATVGECFDSLGRPPNNVLKRYMNVACKHWTFNSRQLQSVVSAFCGHYCIYFCMLRSRGITMNEIVASFSNDTAFNECMVHALICRNIVR